MTPYSGSLGWSSLWQQLGESLINAAATATLIGATIVMGWAHGPTCSSPLEEIFPLGLVWEVEICSISQKFGVYCDQKLCWILSKMSPPYFFESLKKLRIYRRLKRVMKGLFCVLNELLPGQELATCVRQCHAASCLPGSKRSKFCPRSGNRGNLWFYCTFQNPFGNPILFYKLTGVKSHK